MSEGGHGHGMHGLEERLEPARNILRRIQRRCYYKVVGSVSVNLIEADEAYRKLKANRK